MISSLTLTREPTRASVPDDPVEVLRFAISCFDVGSVALATLVEIRGGAARPLGSVMAVAADGRFCGYVSGGCVEAAVAAEALLAMADGRDRTVVFGEGSDVFDIVLPCGGGITVAIHLLRTVVPLVHVVTRIGERQSASLEYRPDQQSLVAVRPEQRALWSGRVFRSVYRPRTRVVISGQSAETQALARLCEASGYDVVLVGLACPGALIADRIDAYTAVALLHHDLDAEAAVLAIAMRSPAFYIGALGSTRTHRRRVDRLKRLGLACENIDRIKAPIGLFGPTRDSTTLALSVLADIAAARLELHA